MKNKNLSIYRKLMIIQHNNGLKGQGATSPRQRLGYQKVVPIALKGQKHFENNKAYALSGRLYTDIFTQGDAQGFNLTGLSGRMQNIGSKLWQQHCHNWSLTK